MAGVDVQQGYRVLTQNPVDSKYLTATATSRLATSPSTAYQGMLVYQQDTREWYRLDGAEGEALDTSNADHWTLIPVTQGGIDFPGSFADLLLDTEIEKEVTTIFAVQGERDTDQQTPIGTADNADPNIDSAFLFNNRIGISLPSGVAVGTLFSILIYSEGDPHTADNLIYSLVGEEVGSTSASTASLSTDFGGSNDSLRIVVTNNERDAIRTGSTTISSSTYAISDGQIEFYLFSEIPTVPELYVFKGRNTSGATAITDWEHITDDPSLIGVDVQAYSVSLDQISGLNSSAGRVIFGSSSGWTSVLLNTLTAGSIVDQNDASTPKRLSTHADDTTIPDTPSTDTVYIHGGNVIDASPTTDDIPEGSGNQYFTPARARQTFSQPTDSSTVTVPPGGQIIVATGRSFYNISEVNQSVSSTTSFVAPDAAVWDRVSSIEFDFQVVSALPGTLTNNTFYFVT